MFIHIFSVTAQCDDGNGCHANATCENMSDSRICICKKGFVGDGRNCKGMFSYCLLLFENI